MPVKELDKVAVCYGQSLDGWGLVCRLSHSIFFIPLSDWVTCLISFLQAGVTQGSCLFTDHKDAVGENVGSCQGYDSKVLLPHVPDGGVG